MLLGQSLSAAIDRLSAAEVPSPRLNAELLLMFILGRDRAYLYGHPERELSPEELARYEELLAERSRGVPAQYITGHQEFWGMDLIVSPAVLIPRPETEHVVENVLELVKSNESQTGETPVTPRPSWDRQTRAKTHAPHIRIVDVGTGSGCIALALAKELPQAEVHATEISSAALDIARANAARHQLDSRIQFHQTDLLGGLEKNSFDFVISNPPYVGESEEESVQLEVRKFEPHDAVFAGPTGTEVIARLIPEAREVLKPRGWLVMEISGTIAAQVEELLGEWKDVRITNDLQGIPRVVSGKRT